MMQTPLMDYVMGETGKVAMQAKTDLLASEAMTPHAISVGIHYYGLGSKHGAINSAHWFYTQALKPSEN